jgi:hypothetical protein
MSPWAHKLEEWLDQNNLISLVPNGSLTHRASRGRPSLIDHIFVNLLFLEHPTFPAHCSVSFESSILLDHAGLSLNIPLYTPPSLPPSFIGWKIEENKKQDWMHSFSLFPLSLITDVPSLIHACQDLLTLTNAVSA